MAIKRSETSTTGLEIVIGSRTVTATPFTGKNVSEGDKDQRWG